MAYSRTTFALTPEDKENLAAIKAARNFTTDAAALRFALDLAAQDAEVGFVGFAAISNERAYRNLLDAQRAAREAAVADSDR